MLDTKKEILSFWFEETHPRQWYRGGGEFDEMIRRRFLSIYNLSLMGVFDRWVDDASGCLALSLLWDQFPRNMFRNTPKAFETDERAREVIHKAIERRYDILIPAQRRVFLYLPLEHSESLRDQEHCVQLMNEIRDDEPIAYDYAERHKLVIDQFGRFPHRNEILGRSSTEDEKSFLALPESRF